MNVIAAGRPHLGENANIAITSVKVFTRSVADSRENSLFQRLLAQAPHDHDVRMQFAEHLISKQSYKAAIDQLMKIVEDEPEWCDGMAQDLCNKVIKRLKLSQPC